MISDSVWKGNRRKDGHSVDDHSMVRLYYHLRAAAHLTDYANSDGQHNV